MDETRTNDFIEIVELPGKNEKFNYQMKESNQVKSALIKNAFLVTMMKNSILNGNYNIEKTTGLYAEDEQVYSQMRESHIK